MSQIDVRTSQPARNTGVLTTFDALRVGDSFVLVTGDYPFAALRQLMGERTNRFEWNVLATAPRFRIQIEKRVTDAPREVLEYMTHDHRRLDALFEQMVALFESGAREDARRRQGEIACGLDRHIHAEEDVLFPVFEGHSGSGPTAIMRDEHVQIRAAMRAIALALDEGTEASFFDAANVFESMLRDHNIKEEHMLYPMVDMMMLDDERAELVRRMQTICI